MNLRFGWPILVTLTAVACGGSMPSAEATKAPDERPGDTTGVRPGIHPDVLLGVKTNPYTGNAAAIVEGRRLFVAYNCSGCHGGRAGGGMGPSLRDSLWTYGSSDTQLLSDILEGRSAGMPAWGKVIPEDQIWKIIAYIRTFRTPQEPDRVLQ